MSSTGAAKHRRPDSLVEHQAMAAAVADSSLRQTASVGHAMGTPYRQRRARAAAGLTPPHMHTRDAPVPGRRWGGGNMACSPSLPWGQPRGWPLRSRVRAGRKWRTIGENKAGGPSLAVPAVLLSTSVPGFPVGLAPHTAPRRPGAGGAGGHLVSLGAGGRFGAFPAGAALPFGGLHPQAMVSRCSCWL